MIPSEHAERALDRLGDLHAFFRTANGALASSPTPTRLGGPDQPPGGRLAAGTATTRTAGELRTLAELALVRIVSIIENFVLDLGRHELEGRLARATVPADLSALVEHLRDFRWDAATGSGSWVKPLKLWDEGLGVRPARDFHDWRALEFVRVTRNIIVHGLGETTDDKWFSTARSLRRVTALGIAEAKAEGRIPVDRSDVDHGMRVARNFVRWLDGQREVV